MVALEVLSLHDRRLDPSLEEELHDGDVDERESDDAEVAGPEIAASRNVKATEKARSPTSCERPLERAEEGAMVVVHAPG